MPKLSENNLIDLSTEIVGFSVIFAFMSVFDCLHILIN